MKLTFLGHQSWIVSHNGTNIYVDPVLTESFGHGVTTQFPIFPPRTVDWSNLPSPSAVVLSHEHHDHFHPISLAALAGKQKIPVFIGAAMPAFVRRLLGRLGLESVTLNDGGTTEIGDLILRLFRCSPNVARWEDKSYQPLISVKGDARLSVFNSVDAPISESYGRQVLSGGLPSPATVIVANNTQCAPVERYSNLLVGKNHTRASSRDALSLIMDGILPSLRGFPDAAQVLICGNGFYEPRQEFGSFLYSDNTALARGLQPFMRCPILGLLPGQSIAAIPEAGPIEESFVQRHEERRRQLVESSEAAYNGDRKLRAIVPASAATCAAPDPSGIDKGLRALAMGIMQAEIGRRIGRLDEYTGKPLGPSRFLLRLLDTSGKAHSHHALNVNEATFERVDISATQALTEYPFGLEMFAVDFLGLCNGDLHVWDVMNVSSRSWFVGDYRTNMAMFMFEYFGEHVQPWLTERVILSNPSILAVLDR
jgi:hypothetical protein